MITDGTSNTVMAIEASDARAVEWTKPVDFTPDKMNFAKDMFGMYPRGANVLFCDGSVHFLSEALDVKMLKNLITRDDGQAVDVP